MLLDLQLLRPAHTCTFFSLHSYMNIRIDICIEHECIPSLHRDTHIASVSGLGNGANPEAPEEPKALSSLEAWLVTACYG